jgi:hypothetical protein
MTGMAVADTSTLSDPLRAAALAFCKECLGWQDALWTNDCGHPYIYEYVDKELAHSPIPPYQRQFGYTHLDQVAKAVREWIRPVDITPAHHARLFATIIPDLFSRFFVGALDEAGLCYELMAACVEANRRRTDAPARLGPPNGEHP